MHCKLNPKQTKKKLAQQQKSKKMMVLRLQRRHQLQKVIKVNKFNHCHRQYVIYLLSEKL